MNINENKRIKRKMKGAYLQITYISATYCPIQPYLVLNECYDMEILSK